VAVTEVGRVEHARILLVRVRRSHDDEDIPVRRKNCKERVN
jgi:hypothetical protein